MEKIYIIKRLLSSLIDKVLILIFFVITFMCIFPYETGKLGHYSALLDESPLSYHSQDEYLAMRGTYGDKVIYCNIEEFAQYLNNIQNQPELLKPFEGETLFRDLQITGFFIIINFIYYFLFEWIFHASLGKKMCGFAIVSRSYKKISWKEAIKRCFILLLLMLLAIYLRFLFNINYYITILLFFLIVDISVFINGKSLIDIMTNTCVVKKIFIENNEKLSNE